MHRQAITLLLAAIAAERVVALPSHGHQHFHAKKDAEPGWQDVDYSKLTYTSYSAGFGTWGSWAPSAPTPAPQPEAQLPGPAQNQGSENQGQAKEQPVENKVVSNNQPSKSDDSEGSSTGSGMAPAGSGPGSYAGKALNNVGSLLGETASKAGANVNEYVGNLGSQYGGNFAMVNGKGDSKYSLNVKNGGSESKRVVMWNKIGQDGSSMNGFIPSVNPPAIDIELAPGKSQMVIVGPNTQGGLCDWTQGLTADKANNGGYGPGAYLCSWAEFNFGDQNNAYSSGAAPNGFDTSNIMKNQFSSSSGASPECAVQIEDTVSGKTSSCSDHVYQSDDQSQYPDGTTSQATGSGSPIHLDVTFS